MWHPNVHTNGSVCVSILHEPGDDTFGYEQAGERWSPVQTVESILISVISMLADPNDESPANIDAAKQYRTFLYTINSVILLFFLRVIFSFKFSAFSKRFLS